MTSKCVPPAVSLIMPSALCINCDSDISSDTKVCVWHFHCCFNHMHSAQTVMAKHASSFCKVLFAKVLFYPDATGA